MLGLEGAGLLLGLLTLLSWFGGWPHGLPPAVPAALLLVVLAARLRAGGARLRRPRAQTLACLGAAVAYRLPALIEPWGWVNRDGAYGAFVALHLVRGLRPAPVFTEGANYQGTLKAHLAALTWVLTPLRDLSLLMTLASLGLYLLFVAASMALARRLGGTAAAWATGLYLALSPRFLTVFSLNCVGQYVDVLALGGLGLALLARLTGEDLGGAPARGPLLGAGLLLGAAFWQQPVALPYLLTAAAVLVLRRRSWSDPWTLSLLPGLALGALPVLIWNALNGWGTAEVVGRDPGELQAQAEALPILVQRTLTTSFPVLVGLSPNHPWRAHALVPALAMLLLPAAFLTLALVHGRALVDGLRRGRPPAALVPLLLALFGLAVFWAVASGRVYWRPRYLLPVLAAGAVGLGVLFAWLWGRARPLAVLLAAGVLALNLSGSLPRLRATGEVAAPYRQLVRALVARRIRTGYADFSQAAPVSMFTAEQVLLSPALGPTPCYFSALQEARVRGEGPDAYVLRPEDDPEAFAAVLRGLGVSYQLDVDPVPIFHRLSRRVAVEEVLGFRGAEGGRPSGGEE